MDTPKRYRPKRKKRLDGKRCVKLKGHNNDFLEELKGKLEDEHIKRYTFIVKGSKLYTQGIFWSDKNQRKYVFRSTYEFAFFYQLEQDQNVLAYIVEPFDVTYYDPRYKTTRIYRPDVIVNYKNGDIKLLEIKPKSKLRNKQVRAKAEGARNFLKMYYPHISYEFITEEQIFKEPGDYAKLLGQIDPARNLKKQLKRQIRKSKKGKFKLSRPGDFGGNPNKQDIDYIKSKLPREIKNSPFMLL